MPSGALTLRRAGEAAGAVAPLVAFCRLLEGPVLAAPSRRPPCFPLVGEEGGRPRQWLGRCEEQRVAQRKAACARGRLCEQLG